MDNKYQISKEESWNYALGMAEAAGGKITPEFLELVEKEKRGEITIEQMREYVIEKAKYYKKLQDQEQELNKADG